MFSEIDNIQNEIDKFNPKHANDIEQFRVKYLGKNGIFTKLFEEFKKVSTDQKKLYGQKLNFLKNHASEKYNSLKNQSNYNSNHFNTFDFTLPSETIKLGTRHPISIVRNELITIFSKIGFTVGF